MSGRWGKHRPKKQLETTLGQAPTQEKPDDLSHLQKPITTSIFGLKEVLSLFQTATEEVHNYISYECDVLYECRICRTIYRSLANFILHKRNFCTEKFSHVGQSSGGFVIDDQSDNSRYHAEENKVAEAMLTPEDSPEKFDRESLTSEKLDEFKENYYRSVTSEHSEETNQQNRSDQGIVKNTPTMSKLLSPVIDKLLKKQEIVQNALDEDLSKIPEEDKEKSDDDDDDVIFVSEESNVLLQKIDSSSAAVFQTVVSPKADASNKIKNGMLMKSEVMEIHGIFDKSEAVLDQDGKICTFGTSKTENSKNGLKTNKLVCSECDLRFSTPKTLTHHIKYKHNQSCIVYPCPDCKEPFANAWSVYRHLYKVHRRTTSQVKRMRAQIHASGIRKDEFSLKKKLKGKTSDSSKVEESDENSWLNNFEEDKDFQMCGGCGKRFERKAALQSHLRMCSKRISVCNSIKEARSLATKEHEGDLSVNIQEKPKGAAKRKMKFPFLCDESQDNCALKEKPMLMSTTADSGEVEESDENHSLNNFEEDKEFQMCSKNISACNSIKEEHFKTKEPDGDLSVVDIQKKNCDTQNNERDSSIKDVEKYFASTPINVQKIQTPKSETVKSCPKRKKKDNDEHVKHVLEQVRKRIASAAERHKIKRRQMLERTNNIDKDTLKTKNDNEETKKCIPIDPQNGTTEIYTISDDDGSDSEQGSIEKLSTITEVCRQFGDSKSPLDTLRQLPAINVVRKRPDLQASSSIPKTYQKFAITKTSSIIPKKLAIRKHPDLETSSSCPKPYQKCAMYLRDEVDKWFFGKVSPFLDKTELKCLSCNQVFVSQFRLLTHMSLHVSWYRFQCSKCSFFSFNQFDCVCHANEHHGTPSALMNSTVLPIPKWKVLKISHDFKPLKDVSNTNEKGCFMEILEIQEDEEEVSEERSMPHLEPAVQHDKDSKLEISGETEKETVSKENNCDDEQRNNTNVKDLNENEASTSSSKVTSNLSNRPVRNRTKSVKTQQNDFIYDLTKALKLNDFSSKYKLKRNISK